MKSFLLLLLPLWSLSAIAQEKSTVPRAQLIVVPDTILIGEPVLIRYQITTSDNSQPNFTGAFNLASFDILRTFDSSWTEEAGKRVHMRAWNATSFDTGRYIIPAQVWEWEGKPYPTPSDTLFVQYSLKQAPADYHDLKDILEIPIHETRWKWIWLPLVGFLLAWMGYRFYQSKKRIPIEVSRPTEPPLPPLESALLRIQRLQSMDPATPADHWYGVLTQIWHQYLVQTCRLPPGELTSDQISTLLQQRLISNSDRTVLEQLFERASLSKFAQHPVESAELKADAETLAHWLQVHDPLFQTPTAAP